MQDAKDSFYEMLRGRLQAINAERTVAIRGVVRPGLIVDENEVPSVCTLPDCFHMQWVECSAQSHGPMTLVALMCEICYASAGSPEFGGMDRGRAMAAMDEELMQALGQSPQNSSKTSYSLLESGQGALIESTRIWWGDPVMAEANRSGERLSRKVTVQVMSLQEGSN